MGASAPARIPLAGPPLDVWRACPGFVSVGVAIDRRATCRLEPGHDGLRIESRDTLSRRDGATALDLLDDGIISLAAHVLQTAGLDSGVRVVTESRVPAEAGLGGTSALAVAVAAAALRSTGREVDPQALWTLCGEAEARWGAPYGVEAAVAAVQGGIVAVRVEPGATRAERVPTDPARVEECLLLFESGAAPLEAGRERHETTSSEAHPSVRAVLDRASALAAELDRALRSHRYDAVGELMREEWRTLEPLRGAQAAQEIERIADAARSAGGAARRCGRGTAVAVWAPPGRAAEVAAAVGQAGLRRILFRVDLRGLEVE